jgi:hypothetical protein
LQLFDLFLDLLDLILDVRAVVLSSDDEEPDSPLDSVFSLPDRRRWRELALLGDADGVAESVEVPEEPLPSVVPAAVAWFVPERSAVVS